MRGILIFIGLVFLSCEKEGLPIDKKYTLNGVYVFKRVSISIVDNATKSGSNYFQNGAVFTNPNEVSGLDTIITDFSLLKVKNNKIFLNAEIQNLDTIWNAIYECSHSDIYSYSGGKLVFYPLGTVRNCTVESVNGKEFVLNSPLFWPYSSNGPAYNVIYYLQKIEP